MRQRFDGQLAALNRELISMGGALRGGHSRHSALGADADRNLLTRVKRPRGRD